MPGAPKHKLTSASSAPWTVAVTELLSDGLWHDYKTVVSEVAPIVPPGPAWRYAEKRRLDEYKKRGTEPGDRKFGDKNSTIRSGQKYYVRNSIGKLKVRNIVEIEYDPNPLLKYKKPIRIRLTPKAVEITQSPEPTHEEVLQKDRKRRDRLAQKMGFENHAERAKIAKREKTIKVDDPSDPVSTKELLDRVWERLDKHVKG